MAEHSSFVLSIAGICLFLLGLQRASDHLQELLANRMRNVLTKLTNKAYLGVFAGAVLTIMIQSSGAVTSMLVGLSAAGVIALREVMSVLLGASVGTTLTVQLLSFHITKFGLAIFAVSFIFYFFSTRRGVKLASGVGIGFGLIFFGLEMIGYGTEHLKQLDFFLKSIDFLKQNPLYTVAITSLFTALAHSSAATIGFAMSLAAGHVITLEESMYWVYGANIGTTATAIIAAAGGNYLGRQVAWAHCLFKIVSVGGFYFFTEPFARLVSTEHVVRDIANAHTLFNVIALVAFFPFISHGARLIEYLFPPSPSDKAFGVKYLNRGNFETTTVAIAHAQRELLRMGDIVGTMVRDSIDLFRGYDHDLIQSIKKRDDKVDLLNREINMFVARYVHNASRDESRQMLQIVSFAADLETAADVIDNSILEMAAKKQALKVEFSPTGWKEINRIYEMVTELVPKSLSCFQLQDENLAKEIIAGKRKIRLLEKQLRESHLERLVQGVKETINTSSIHMDLLNEYRRIVGLFCNHAYVLLKE